MGNRSSQLYMPHSFSSHLGFCYFNTAFITDYALVSDLLIFSTVTFPVLLGTEYPFAEKSVWFRLERSVVDSFRFCDFASGPAQYLFCGGQADLQRFEIVQFIINIVFSHDLPPIHLLILIYHLLCLFHHPLFLLLCSCRH